MTEGDLAVCARIIREGDAVDPESAVAELPQSSAVAVARTSGDIVAVGAIKRIRPDYASRIALRGKADFSPGTPELGYVAVDKKHRGKHLSSRIVAELLKMNHGPLFATTDDERMKRTLANAGFERTMTGTVREAPYPCGSEAETLLNATKPV